MTYGKEKYENITLGEYIINNIIVYKQSEGGK